MTKDNKYKLVLGKSDWTALDPEASLDDRLCNGPSADAESKAVTVEDVKSCPGGYYFVYYHAFAHGWVYDAARNAPPCSSGYDVVYFEPYSGKPLNEPAHLTPGWRCCQPIGTSSVTETCD